MSSKYIGGVNSNTYELLFDEERLSGNSTLNNNRNIFFIIDVNNLSNIFEKVGTIILHKIFFNGKIELKRISYDEKDSIYTYMLDNNDKLSFRRLSDYLKRLTKEDKKELLSTRRYGHCHDRSLYLGIGNKKSKILSGICTLDNKSFYHSVLELENGNIIDWTTNLIMNKSDYEKLTDFKVISSIDSEDLEELLTINKLSPKLNIRMYLYFRDELVDDLDKHNLI